MTLNKFVKFVILKNAPIVKLINRILGLRLLISRIPGLALRMHVELLDKPQNSTQVLEALPSKVDIKRHLQVFSIYMQSNLYLTQ